MVNAEDGERFAEIFSKYNYDSSVESNFISFLPKYTVVNGLYLYMLYLIFAVIKFNPFQYRKSLKELSLAFL